MATITSNRTQTRSPQTGKKTNSIDSSATKVVLEPLLRPEYPTDDPRCLPFVCFPSKGERNKNERSVAGRLWAPEALPQHLAALEEGEQGSACAAAYLCYLKLNPNRFPSPNLYQITRAMQPFDRRSIFFFSELERYLSYAVTTMEGSDVCEQTSLMIEHARGHHSALGGTSSTSRFTLMPSHLEAAYIN